MAEPNLDDPLYRKVVVGDTLTYYLAYRSVLIRPSTPLPANIQQILPKTIAINVVGAQKHKTIYAEELVLLSGSRYDFVETHLTIHCRSIRFCDVQSGPVVFNCSGKNDDTARQDGTQPAQTAAANFEVSEGSIWTGGSNWGSNGSLLHDKREAASGSSATDGVEGKQGGAAGSFTLSCDILCNPAEIGSKFSIQVLTCGGKGSDGGNGGKGGKGGNAVTLKSSDWLKGDDCGAEPWSFFWVVPLYRPARGGNGGNARSGGYGGNGGNINITMLLNSKVATEDDKKKLFLFNSSKGPNGADGTPGEPGDTGDKAPIKLHTWSMTTDRIPDRWELDTHFPVTKDGQFLWEYLDSSTNHDRGSTTLITNLDKVNPLGATPQKGSLLARTSGTTPADGNVIVKYASSSAELCAPNVIDFRHLAMITDRLIFEHFIYFTLQKYNSPNQEDPVNSGSVKGLLTPYGQSKAWLDAIMDSLEVHFSDGANAKALPPLQDLQLKALRGAYHDFRDFTNRGIDIYRNSLNKVSQPGLGVKQMVDTNKAYVNLEAALAGVVTVLQASVQKGEELRANIVNSLHQAQVSIEKRDELVTYLGSLTSKIVAADSLVQSQKINVESALALVKAQIAAKVHCEVSDALSALSNLALFYNPEVGAMYAVGAIAEMGNGGTKSIMASTDTLPTETGGKIDKKYLYSRIKTVAEGLDPMETLQAEFKRANGEKSHNPDYLSQVKMQASKFEEMCSQFYSIPGIKDAKQKFKQFIQAIQAKNDLLDEYNDTVLKIAKLQLQADTMKVAEQGFQAAAGADVLQNDELQVAYSYLEQTRSAMKKLVLYKFYNVVRTFNCIMMTHSEMVAPLAELQSFHEVNSTTLSVTFDTWFREKDLSRMRDFFVQHQSASTEVHIDIFEKDYESIFSMLRKKGQFTFTLDPETASHLGPSGFQDNWFDVRYTSVEVYLPGAVRLEESNEDLAEPPIVHMTVSTLGSCKVLDVKLQEHRFLLPPTSVPFSYTYQRDTPAGKLPGSVSLKKHSDAVTVDALHFELEENHMHDIYLSSPFTTWNVRLSGFHSEEEIKKNPELTNKIDLTKCSTVQFRFKIVHRATNNDSIIKLDTVV